MAISFKFYTDAGLTAELASNLLHNSLMSVSNEDKDFRLYFGSTASGTKLQRATNPGVNQVTLEPTDSNTGAAPATTAIKLALSQAGLTTAVPGASLAIGTSVLSGVSQAVEIWVRVTNTLTTLTADSTLGGRFADVDEVPA